MAKIIYFFRSEIIYFTKSISPNARRIMVSNTIRALSNPLMGIFMNAFVWRATNSLLAVSFFNMSQFVGLPVGFFLNGLMLRKVHIEKVFAFGAALTGLMSLVLVIAGSSNAQLIPLYGFFWGVGRGFYWGNRNYLELQETTNEWRQYFYGLLTSIHSVANIIIPFMAGWFIVLVQYFGILSVASAYWALFGIAFVLMMLSAKVIWKGGFETPAPKIISRLGIFPFWGKRRLLNIAAGLFDGTEYVAVLLVLYVLGNEGVLGTISSVTAICVAAALYGYGRNVTLSHAKRTILSAGLVFLLCALSLIFLRQEYAAGIYFIGIGLALKFFQVAADPTLLSLADEEMNGKNEERYSLIFDNELFLNIGRLLGISIIVGLVFFSSERTGFFYAPLIFSALHLIFLMLFMNKSVKEFTL
ncbi:MAG: hypothetical protein M3M85_02520 [bacterium]|nr:hypothetical protein [bacterium]